MAQLLPKPVRPSAQAATQAATEPTAQPARKHVNKGDIVTVTPLRIHAQEGDQGLGLICAIEGDVNVYLPEKHLIMHGQINVEAYFAELIEKGEVLVEVCWVAWKKNKKNNNKATKHRQRRISLAEIS